jgi:hypothetical protein
LQKILPNLADQLEKNDKLAQDQKGIYQAMSDPQWWSKNVIASYAISMVDAKVKKVLSIMLVLLHSF